MPGVDLKAHPNNYVVVAPSKLNGNSYEWLNHFSIKPAPKGLIDLITKKQVAKQSAYTANYISSNKNKTVQLFELISNGLGDVGQLNANLTRFIGGLLYRGVEPHAATELALIANDHSPSPLPTKEVYATVNSIMDREIKRRGMRTF